MSFIRTLATLAAGFAAARGMEKFRQIGGADGLQQMMRANPATAGMADQMSAMMQGFGLPGGTGAMEQMLARFGLGQGSDNAMAGLNGLMAALGGAAAIGAEQSGAMIDAMTGTSAASALTEENAKLMIRAMIQAAKVDGEIDAQERAHILEHLGEVDARERAFVEAQMAAPVDVNALANDTAEQMRAQIYAASLMTVKLDSRIEADYMQALATALGLSEDVRHQLHQAMGIG